MPPTGIDEVEQVASLSKPPTRKERDQARIKANMEAYADSYILAFNAAERVVGGNADLRASIASEIFQRFWDDYQAEKSRSGDQTKNANLVGTLQQTLRGRF